MREVLLCVWWLMLRKGNHFGNVVSHICVMFYGIGDHLLDLCVCPVYLCILSVCVSRIYVVNMHTDLSELLPIHLNTQQT